LFFYEEYRDYGFELIEEAQNSIHKETSIGYKTDLPIAVLLL